MLAKFSSYNHSGGYMVTSLAFSECCLRDHGSQLLRGVPLNQRSGFSDAAAIGAAMEAAKLVFLQDHPRQSQGGRSRTGGSGLQQRVQHRQTGGQGAVPVLLPARSVNASSQNTRVGSARSLSEHDSPGRTWGCCGDGGINTGSSDCEMLLGDGDASPCMPAA